MKKMFIFLLASLVSATVTAEPKPSYTYAGIQYTSEELDDFDCTQDGIAISGSLLINEDIFAIASFRDVSGGGCGSSTLGVGAGYRFEIHEDFSLYATLSFEDTSVDEGDGDSGLVAAGGIRSFIAENLEAHAELAKRTAFDGDTLISGGLNFWFTPALAATGEIGFGSDSSNIEVGVRMNF